MKPKVILTIFVILSISLGWYLSVRKPNLVSSRPGNSNVPVQYLTHTTLSSSSVKRDTYSKNDPLKVQLEEDQTKQKRNLADQKAKEAFELSQKLDLKDSEAAITLFKAALALDQRNRFALEQFANHYMLNKDFERALPLLKQCLEYYPSDSNCIGNLSTYYSKANNTSAIDQISKQCLAADPQNLICLNNLGLMYLKQSNYRDALIYYKQMEAINSQSTLKFNPSLIEESIGMCYAGLGDQSLATEYYQLACKQGSANACRALKH